MSRPDATLAESAADALFYFLNVSHTGDIPDFITAMATSHRTIQQCFTGMCFLWLHDLAKRESWDLRNEASCEWARKILASHPDLPKSLPFI
jgi:hypothetical protein